MLDIAGGILIAAAIIGLFAIGIIVFAASRDSINADELGAVGGFLMLAASGLAAWIIFFR